MAETGRRGDTGAVSPRVRSGLASGRFSELGLAWTPTGLTVKGGLSSGKTSRRGSRQTRGSSARCVGAAARARVCCGAVDAVLCHA